MMSDQPIPDESLEWRVDWRTGQTRLRVFLFAVSAASVTVIGSIAGMFPEAVLLSFLTGSGYADAGGWVVILAGNAVQLACVLLALAIFFEAARWISAGGAEIDDLDVRDKDEVLRRMGRPGFLFALLVATAFAAQIVITVGESFLVSHVGWMDAAFMNTFRMPAAIYLLLVAGGLIAALGRLLATNGGSTAAT